MTKQELDQAYADGRLNQENYRLAIQKIALPPEIQSVQPDPIVQPQTTVDPAMQALAQQPQIDQRYNQLLNQYQASNVNMPKEQIEKDFVLPILEQEQKRNEVELVQKEKADKEALAKQQEVEERKKSLGLTIGEQSKQDRQPTQDGQKPQELVINPAAQQQAGMIADTTPKTETPTTTTPEVQPMGLGQMQSAYADVGQIEKEFNAKIKQVQLDDQRQQESNYEAQMVMKNQLIKADELNKDFENGSQIDPGRYWGKADTWSKIGAVLGAAFSGYAQAYTGGRNAGLDMIMDLTNKDIEAQVKNASLAQAKAQSAMNMYERYRQTFKDDQAAYEATKLSSLNLIKAKYDMAQGKFKNAADMAKLNAEIQTSSAALQNKLLENGSSIALAIDANRNPNALFDNELNKDPARLASLIKDKKIEAMRLGNNVLYIENNDLRKKAGEYNSAVNAMNGILDQMKNIRNKSKVYSAQDASDFEKLRSMLITEEKAKSTLGTLDKGLLDFAKNLFSGIEYRSFLTDADKSIDFFKKQVNSNFDTFVNSNFSSKQRNVYTGKLGTPPDLKTMGRKLQ